MKKRIKCNCPSEPNEGYYCEHKNWISSSYVKNKYRNIKTIKEHGNSNNR